MLEEPLRGVEKVARDQEVFRIAIADLTDALSIEIVEHGTRVAQENRRMGRYEELRMPRCCEVVDDLQERELSLRRQRRFRLIQDVETCSERLANRAMKDSP
jgi:hypothetical protein